MTDLAKYHPRRIDRYDGGMSVRSRTMIRAFPAETGFPPYGLLNSA